MNHLWILITILLAFIVGAALIAVGTGLEWIRLSQLLDTPPEKLISLVIIILGALFIFVSYIVQLYLLLHHDITLYHVKKQEWEPLIE